MKLVPQLAHALTRSNRATADMDSQECRHGIAVSGSLEEAARLPKLPMGLVVRGTLRTSGPS